MKTIVLNTPKGGSGKSTTARELAVSASLAGVSVAMADLDPQATTTGWYQRRKAAAPPLVRYDPASPAPIPGVDWLVIDTPPGYPAYIPALLAHADLVLVPVRPSPDDLLAAAPIAHSLAGRPWAFVLTQVPARSRLVAAAIRQLAALGRVAPSQFGFRVDFPTAAIHGEAAIEFEDSKAAEETAELLAYVTLLLKEGHSA